MIMTVPTDGKPKNVNTAMIENRGMEANIGYRITPGTGSAMPTKLAAHGESGDCRSWT